MYFMGTMYTDISIYLLGFSRRVYVGSNTSIVVHISVCTRHCEHVNHFCVEYFLRAMLCTYILVMNVLLFGTLTGQIHSPKID